MERGGVRGGEEEGGGGRGEGWKVVPGGLGGSLNCCEEITVAIFGGRGRGWRFLFGIVREQLFGKHVEEWKWESF